MAATIPADNLFSHSSAGYKTFYTRPSKVSYEKERSQIPTLFENYQNVAFNNFKFGIFQKIWEN